MLEDLLTEHFLRQLKELKLVDYNGKERPLLDFLLPYIKKLKPKAMGEVSKDKKPTYIRIDLPSDNPEASPVSEILERTTGYEIDKDGDLINWSYEHGRMVLTKEQITAAQQEIETLIQGAVIQELENVQAAKQGAENPSEAAMFMSDHISDRIKELKGKG